MLAAMVKTSSSLMLSPTAARSLHLAAQGLLRPWARRARKVDVLASIERMQLLQIDTIHVVARSPYLVLFSRLGQYPASWLDELLAEAAIFETWAHEACFAPMSSWPLLRQQALDKHHHWAVRSARRTHDRGDPGMLALLERIRREGALRSSDFRDGDRPSGGWWGWKDEKRWLEAWFALGDLMVARRERFQRVYDISERVLARGGIDLARYRPMPPQVMRRHLIERSVKALGIARPEWLADYYRLGGKVEHDELQELVTAGRLFQVEVRGWSGIAYVHTDLSEQARAASAGRLRASLTTVLSPFDPVVWDRRRARELFGFDYRLECYVPEPKRQFGYFVLPILHRGRIIGRLDAKAHRADGVFEIRRIALEDQVVPDDATCMAIAQAIGDLARWHDCADVLWPEAAPERRLAKMLGAALVAARAAANRG